ncbi:hypothetical protein C8J57DRAFT_1179002 [Mycena rebaudengoi]|nr:hypothetical protein C8J57DRAFT_1179002 [Mycena rebaudengoi]
MCLPIIFGCSDKVKSEGDPTNRICPNCQHASVLSAKSTSWFELFWVPLIPFSSEHIWLCQICHWKAPNKPGLFEPALAGGGAPPLHHNQSSYQPSYMNAPPAPPPNTYHPQYVQGPPQKQ